MRLVSLIHKPSKSKGQIRAQGQTWSNASAGDRSATVEITLPRFVMGHPVLGAIPSDPTNNPTWRL